MGQIAASTLIGGVAGVLMGLLFEWASGRLGLTHWLYPRRVLLAVVLEIPLALSAARIRPPPAVLPDPIPGRGSHWLKRLRLHSLLKKVRRRRRYCLSTLGQRPRRRNCAA